MDTGEAEDGARQTVYKVLIPILTLCVLALNVGLFYTVVRAAHGLVQVITGPRGPRLLTVTSIAFGDLIAALFSLAVMTRLVYVGQSELTCKLLYLSGAYLDYVMPAIYGIGLMVLAVESVNFRNRVAQDGIAYFSSHNSLSEDGDQRSHIGYRAYFNPTCCNSGTYPAIDSISTSALPWTYGGAVTFALTYYGGFELLDCSGEFIVEFKRVVVWACLIVPSVLACIAAFHNIIIVKLTANSYFPFSPLQHHGLSRNQQYNPLSIQYPENQETDNHRNTRVASPYQSPTETLNIPPQTHTRNTSPTRTQQNIHTTAMTEIYHSVSLSSENEPLLPHRAPNHNNKHLYLHYSCSEASHLFALAFAHLVFCLPLAIIQLTYEKADTTAQVDIYQDTITFLLPIRACAMPLIWLLGKSLRPSQL